MKGLKRIVFLLVMVLMAGCAPGLLAAKISLKVARAGLGVADVGMAEANQANQAVCLAQDPTQGAGYQKCRESMEKKLQLYEISKRVAGRSFDAAEAGIAAYEAKKAGKEIDIWILLKTGGCAVLSVLAYIPEKYRKSAQVYIDLGLTGLQCPK